MKPCHTQTPPVCLRVQRTEKSPGYAVPVEEEGCHRMFVYYFVLYLHSFKTCVNSQNLVLLLSGELSHLCERSAEHWSLQRG